MIHLVTRESLLEKIGNAANSESDFLALRNYVFDHYAAEDEYVFESENLKLIFAVLLPYLHSEEALGDEQRGARLSRLQKALLRELSPEAAVLALEYDRIALLLGKLNSGVIPQQVFAQQMRKLYPVNYNWLKVIDLYNSRPDPFVAQ
jgi:hypothetical protein